MSCFAYHQGWRPHKSSSLCQHTIVSSVRLHCAQMCFDLRSLPPIPSPGTTVRTRSGAVGQQQCPLCSDQIESELGAEPGQPDADVKPESTGDTDFLLMASLEQHCRTRIHQDPTSIGLYYSLIQLRSIIKSLSLRQGLVLHYLVCPKIGKLLFPFCPLKEANT